MDAQTINQTYDLLTLALGDIKLKHSGQFYIGPCPFCGGRDRFNLKQTSDGWRWFCRHCGGEKYHGPIDYIMRRDHLDFKQALESLGGHLQIAPRVQAAPSDPDITLPDQAWQVKAWSRIDESFKFLQSQAGEPGQHYLAERAVSVETVYTYLVGYVPNKYCTMARQGRPAIVVPWFDTGLDGGTITAIKYRFIDDLARDPKHRYIMEGGSVPVLFGLHAAAGHHILILIEGEINAMSISQTSARDLLKIDALSFGSQSSGRASVLRRVAQGYQRVIVWADDPEKAKEISLSLDRSAAALCSPVIDHQKYDANALLQKGWLGDFLHEAVL